MKKKVFVLEYQKGSDKGFDGFRPDTKPILNAIEKSALIKTEIVFYNPFKSDELFEYLKKNAHCVISRINPGNLKEIDEYYQFLNALSYYGIEVHTHPNVMINLDFKDILFKLRNTILGEKTTTFYQSKEQFKNDFPQVLNKEKIRVLKTNYGSTGEGVYLVSLNNDGSISCKEAVNNKTENFDTLNSFMDYFAQNFEEEDLNAVYFRNKKGYVSCKYLKRISEGEIRVLFVKDKPISVVHKKPKEGEFSATLFSGAQYMYESPTLKKWNKVVDLSMQGLDVLKPYCNDKGFPLLWTMDYILDYDLQMNDVYILSEINCSCVGITTQLQYSKEIAEVFKEKDLIKKYNRIKKAKYLQ